MISLQNILNHTDFKYFIFELMRFSFRNKPLLVSWYTFDFNLLRTICSGVVLFTNVDCVVRLKVWIKKTLAKHHLNITISLSVFYPSPRLGDRKHTTRCIKIISNSNPWEILYMFKVNLELFLILSSSGRIEFKV